MAQITGTIQKIEIDEGRDGVYKFHVTAKTSSGNEEKITIEETLGEDSVPFLTMFQLLRDAAANGVSAGVSTHEGNKLGNVVVQY